MTSTVNLLPCPFCGGEPKYEVWSDRNYHKAECLDCAFEFDYCQTYEELEASWNKRVAPTPCLHQIQDPAAAEQAAWHAGLDEGRAQAAPAAVAVPELQDMLRELRVQISAITVQLPQSVDCSGVWMAHDKMSAALAATPAAAPVELPEHWGVCVGGRIWIGKTPEHVLKLAEQEGMNPTLLFTEQQVRALLATGGQAQADLSSVIAWLEGGCDPKHAAAELRLIAGKAAPQQADARDALDQSGWVSVDDALPEHAISEVLILQMYFEADGTARMHDKEDPALGYLYNIAKGHCHQDGSVPRWSGRSGDDFGLLFRGGWRVAAWRHIHPASNYVGHIAAISAAKGK